MEVTGEKGSGDLDTHTHARTQVNVMARSGLVTLAHTHSHAETHTEVVCARPGFCSAEQAASQQSPYGLVLKSEHREMEGRSQR